MRAVRKVEAIREDLGKVGPVIAEQVQEAMLGRRVKLDTVKAEKDAEPVRKMLKIERDISGTFSGSAISWTKPSANCECRPRTFSKSCMSACNWLVNPR